MRRERLPSTLPTATMEKETEQGKTPAPGTQETLSNDQVKVPGASGFDPVLYLEEKCPHGISDRRLVCAVNANLENALSL